MDMRVHGGSEQSGEKEGIHIELVLRDSNDT